VAHKVIFAPEARRDLFDLYDFIAARSGPARAMGYIERIERHCFDFAKVPERGTRRDDLRPGLRTVGFERRILIAFHFGDEKVTIDRILYGGRDLGKAFRPNEKRKPQFKGR
jgi:toxin ParE1/3/4